MARTSRCEGLAQVGEVFNIQRVKSSRVVDSGEKIPAGGFVWGRTIAVRPGKPHRTGLIYCNHDGEETGLQYVETTYYEWEVQGGELPPGFTREEADHNWPL